MQGTREYFETILMEMEDGSPEQQEIAEKLQTAYSLGHVQYAVVQSKVEDRETESGEAANEPNGAGSEGGEQQRKAKRYGGFVMKYFDIRNNPEEQA
jgi:hypothetical protein